MEDTKLQAMDFLQQIAKVEVDNAKKRGVKFAIVETGQKEETELEKSIRNSIEEIRSGGHIARIAFTEDPSIGSQRFIGTYRKKVGLLPDELLKKISIQDELVALVLTIRSNQAATFGREIQDRFSMGWRIEPKKGVMERANRQQKEILLKKIQKTSSLLGTCGSTEGVLDKDKLSFPQYMGLQARNGLLFGRHGTEKIRTTDLEGNKKFHSFRPIDISTIFPVVSDLEEKEAKAIRKEAFKTLKEIHGQEIKPESQEAVDGEDFSWVQVVNGMVKQCFTEKELVVQNLYPCTDYQYGGFPVTPIDMIINSIITHINIGTYNRLFFQNGRASRGVVVIKSEDVDQSILTQLNLHFSASINDSSKAFRTPVFGIGAEDDIKWVPMEMQGGRDAEFQYLSDANCRMIFAAFQLSPTEVPGFDHLSKGTQNQALSESANEYKLEAARDVGIRPLLSKFQDFINQEIIPELDPDVAELCVFKFYGLDSDTREKEAARLQQAATLWMSYDDILAKVEKPSVGKELLGTFPLNQGYQTIVDKYLTVGQVLYKYTGDAKYLSDPRYDYVRDSFWFQQQRWMMEKQQFEMEMQQMQQQPQGGDPQEGGESEDGGGSPGTPTNQEKAEEKASKVTSDETVDGGLQNDVATLETEVNK